MTGADPWAKWAIDSSVARDENYFVYEWILYRVYPTSGKRPESGRQEKLKMHQEKERMARRKKVKKIEKERKRKGTPAVRISIAPRHQTMQKQDQLHVRVCVLYVLVQTHRVPTTFRLPLAHAVQAQKYMQAI